ncbi:MAG: acyl carrier protein [Acholeplasmatales bacterium]|nr:acyl carrier protein [Acholeplasmatales bacterium]
MIFDKVKEIIVNELSVEADKVTPEANLKEDLGADSIDAVEVIMSLEDEFNVSISDDAAQNIKTVQDLVNYIEAEQAK